MSRKQRFLFGPCSLWRWREQRPEPLLVWHNVYQRNEAARTPICWYRLHHEMHVSFSTCDNNIHPDAHGLGGRSHHVVHPIVGLHAERQRGVGALGCGRECHFVEKSKWHDGEWRGEGRGDVCGGVGEKQKTRRRQRFSRKMVHVWTMPHVWKKSDMHTHMHISSLTLCAFFKWS